MKRPKNYKQPDYTEDEYFHDEDPYIWDTHDHQSLSERVEVRRIKQGSPEDTTYWMRKKK